MHHWVKLISGPNLIGWDSIGDGSWTVMQDGTLIGQRNVAKPSEHQAWLYTRKEFTNFDLHLEWWLRLGGNSGVSIRDTSRARYAVGTEWNAERTPSHMGYEIQLSNGYIDKYPSGSVYLFDAAKSGSEIANDWNTLDVSSRPDLISVRLNGKLVSESKGDPARPKTGPIGLQLHDRNTVVMFRHIRIHEIK